MYFGQKYIEEAASGSVFFNDGIRIRLDDEFGNTRAQIQANTSKEQGSHGGRLKITAPENCKGYTIVIPNSKNKAIYVKKGNQSNPKRLPNEVQEVKKFAENNRDDLTDFWTNAADEDKQVEIFKKIIDNEKSIDKVSAFSNNEVNKSVNDYIKQHKEKKK